MALMAAGLIGLVSVWWLQPESAFGDWLTRRSYDALFALAGERDDALTDSPVVIVYLDLESHHRENQDPALPWDRTLHARLVDRLTAAGARAVVFDIVFSGPAARPGADLQFAAALATNGHAVLAAELNRTSSARGNSPGVRMRSPALPVASLLDSAAGWGLAYHQPDTDFVVRQQFAGYLEEGQPSLTWATAKVLKLPGAAGESIPERRWMNYYGRAFAIPHVSYSEALNGAVPESFFRDRVVLIGGRPKVGFLNEARDELRSPFATWNDREPLMPGVEIHATQMLNLLRRDWLTRASATGEAAVVWLSAGILCVGLFWLRPWKALVAAGLFAGVAMWGATFAFQKAHAWFPWLIVVGVQLPLALVGSIATHSVEWYRHRRRLEGRIREQAALITKAQDAIIVRDLAGRITFANPSAQQLLGWNEAELGELGVSAQIFSAADPAAAEAQAQTTRVGEWLGELQQRARDGARLTLQSRWTLIRHDTGAPKAILIVSTDITEKKRLEAEYLRAQRMETIGALAGGMAHDLNNALAPILMGVQRLQRRPHDEDTGHMLAIMESNTHRGADMVRQVLLLARGRDAERARVDLLPLLREIEHIVTQTFPKTIRVAVMTPPDLWAVQGNSTQLHQALLNLCVNARDAMSEGGELSLTADNVELAAAEAEAVPGGFAGAFVLLLVADTGTGIAPDLLPRLFEPFVTTKAIGQGTGLGLATVARIVRGHGGFLQVRSEVGVGTTFELYLPRLAQSVASETPTVVSKPDRGHGELVLVADDEQAIRDMLAATLVDAGFNVLTATDGVETLRRLRETAASVRCLLLDADMPFLDGRHTLRRLREFAPHLPVVFMSGELRESSAVAGEPGVAFLAKPFDATELVRVVAAQVQGGPAAG